MRFLSGFLMLMMFTGNVLAQKISVTGKVTDASDSSPLFGVSIGIAGTAAGTISDPDGNFKLEVPSKESVIMFSFVGYKPQKIVVGDQLQINVVMVQEIKQLDQVVVVGYGTQRKKDLTGSIALCPPKRSSRWLCLVSAMLCREGRPAFR